MSILKRQLMALLGGTFLCTCTLAGGAAYLVHVGPAPLRFASATPRLNPASVLPTLNMGGRQIQTNDVHQASEPFPIQDQTAEPIPPTDSQTLFSPLPTPSVPVPGPSLVPTQPPTSAQVTPQMLLKYFNLGTNRDVVVPAQMEFTPPSGTMSRGSTATYISP